MNFLQYKTPEELFIATGLTVHEALEKVNAELNAELEELKEK